MRWLMLLLFPCFFLSLNAQTTRADSLFAIWSDTTNSADARVEAFYQRFSPFLRSDTNNPETVRWASGIKEVQRLAQEVGKTDYEAKFIFLESSVYLFITGEMDKCCPLANQAFEKALEIKDFRTAFFALSTLQQCIEQVPSFFDLDFEQLDIRLSDAVNLDSFDVNQLPYLFNMGDVHFSNSRFPEALYFFQKIISKSEEYQLQNDFRYVEALGLVGIIHLFIKNLEDAENYLLKATQFAKKNKNENTIGSIYTDLASLYVVKNNIDRATSCLDTALQVMEGKQHCEACLNKVYRVKASIYNLKDDHSRALQELQKLEPFYGGESAMTHLENIGAFYTEIGLAYLGLEQYKNAISACKVGIKKTKGYLLSSVDSYKVMYEAYQAIGKHQQALESYQKHVTASDSITELRNAQKVTRQELAFQYDQQRLADSLQLVQQNLQQELIFQKEISRQKNNRNILLALGLLAAFIALGLYLRYRFLQKTKAELEAKNQIIEAEKEKAQASEQAKHQFLANMSHEIRTPMNAIKGMTDILIRREPKNQQRTYLNAIKESSNSLLVIINDILDMSKIEAGKIDLENIPFSLQEVIQNVKMISQFKAEEKGLTLQTNIEKGSHTSVQGDPTRLHQVLLNLVGNAIKFTEKGVVTIQLKTEVLESENKINTHFCVSDTGVGIGQDRLEKIFESFEQAYSDTTRKFGGTGLGLSISKKLVEIQEGKIWAESTKGKGSQFYFSIPYEISNQVTEAATSQDVADNKITELKGVKILLVEDNHFNAIVAKEELEDAIKDVVVEVAEHGVIAVEKITHNDFDIILMDIQMPVMNGYEATKVIRNLSNGKSNIPIIAMTANVMKEEVERCYEAGMDDFIGKPFDTEDLISKLAKLTNR
jgi:signal transduction histidine kinase/ActR/RegA family two-component response regulator